jgi:hypothetical protein
MNCAGCQAGGKRASKKSSKKSSKKTSKKGSKKMHGGANPYFDERLKLAKKIMADTGVKTLKIVQKLINVYTAQAKKPNQTSLENIAEATKLYDADKSKGMKDKLAKIQKELGVGPERSTRKKSSKKGSKKGSKKSSKKGSKKH